VFMFKAVEYVMPSSVDFFTANGLNPFGDILAILNLSRV
jgi:hypothetical protein